MKQKKGTKLLYFILFFSYSITFSQIMDLSKYRPWLNRIMKQEDADRLLQSFYQKNKEEAENERIRLLLERKHKKNILPLQNTIQDIEEKIRELGDMERDEFETRVQFSQRKKNYEKYNHDIKVLRNKISKMDHAFQMSIPCGVSVIPPCVEGYVTLSSANAKLEKFDIDNLCFTILLCFDQPNITLESFSKTEEEIIWEGTISYKHKEPSKGNRLNFWDTSYGYKEKKYEKIFKLQFKTPEDAKIFKEEFETGKRTLPIPVEISFTLESGKRSIELSPEETEIDTSAVARNVGKGALISIIVLAAEAISPGSTNGTEIDSEDFGYENIHTVTKRAEYKSYTVYSLHGIIGQFYPLYIMPPRR